MSGGYCLRGPRNLGSAVTACEDIGFSKRSPAHVSLQGLRPLNLFQELHQNPIDQQQIYEYIWCIMMQWWFGGLLTRNSGNIYKLLSKDSLDFASIRHFVWSDNLQMLRLEPESFLATVEPSNGVAVSGSLAAPAPAPAPPAPRKETIPVATVSIPATAVPWPWEIRIWDVLDSKIVSQLWSKVLRMVPALFFSEFHTTHISPLLCRILSRLMLAARSKVTWHYICWILSRWVFHVKW